MAQELEQIVEVLREMTRANNNNSDGFDKLLANINSKLDMISKNEAAMDLVKAYLVELAKTTDAKYSITATNLGNIEKTIDTIFDNLGEHAKNKAIKKSFDTFTKNLNKFYAEATSQKDLVAAIEEKIADLPSEKPDKKGIRTKITRIKKDFESLSHGYKKCIDAIASDLNSILTNIAKADTEALIPEIQEQLESLHNAIDYISKDLAEFSNKDENLNQLFENVATNENLKVSQSVIDAIIEKNEDVSIKLETQEVEINDEFSKEIFADISKKAENLGSITEEIRHSLTKVSKDIDSIPDTTDLEKSLQKLFKELDSISKDLDNTALNGNIKALKTKFSELTKNLSTIKNIVSELNETITLKVLTAINDLSFEKEFSEIKDNISKILAILPKKEDINKLLVSIKEQKVAIEELTQKADKIEEKIDSINFDEEFANIYDKTASIESWLISSKIKENAETVATQIEEKFDSISSYLNNANKNNAEEIKRAISEIKEILENKKSNFREVEKENLETIKSVENYLKEIKVILDTSDNDLNEEVKTKLDDIEASLKNYENSNECAITAIIAKLDEYQYKIDMDTTPTVDLAPSLAEISEIKDHIIDLATSFKSLELSNPEQASSSAFVSEILNELGANLEDLSTNIDDKLQHGFVYNAELIEEKTAKIIDFIRELKESSEKDSNLYNKLDEADNKLDDYKQELEFINTDVINSLGAKTEQLLEELEPIKEMLATLVDKSSEAKDSVKDNLENIHETVLEDLAECTKYSKSTYDKLEDSYEKISKDLTDTENNLRDFILGDIDSVIIKIDNLRDDLEESLNRISPPEAECMDEFRKFVQQIAEFKGNPTALVAEAKEEIAQAVSETLALQHEELKSMLAVSIHNDEIIAAIEELKACFNAKIEELSEIKQTYQEEITDFDELEDFSSNQYEKAFEVDKNAEIISELKEDFDKFSELIKDLSEENTEISEVLDVIKSKMDIITVESVVETDSTDETKTDKTPEQASNKVLASINANEMKEMIEAKVKEVIVGAGNFDFIKAFDLMKQDILALQDKVTQILSKEQQKEASSTLASIPTIPFEASNSKLLTALDEKIELLTKTINPKEWLGEIKTYLAGDKIHDLLEEISGKIDILTLADNTDMVREIKDAITALSANDNEVTTDPQIQFMLDLINEKVDILAANDDYELIEEVRDAIERIDDNINNNNILNTISSKLDVIAEVDTISEFEEIKDSLSVIEDQFDSVKQLSESDEKITSMLETLSSKIDSLSDSETSQKGFEDVKALIMAQTDFIENLEKNGKTEAVKKCLEKLTLEVNNLVTGDNTKQLQKSIREMKESIMAAVVTVFEQVSFVEESEDIKDFVEEKTDEINQNLASVTTQLKQITNSEEDSDYVYSMQDIESDLAKLRLALSNLQENEEENQAQRLTSILENINTIGASVEELQNSITKDEYLNNKFERVSTDFEDFGKVITDKVDNVTKLLETSQASDKVMRQALIYMGEWIDSASESMDKISTNAEEISDIKSAINSLKKSVPEQTDILNSIEEKFDEQQERLAFFEKQIAKLGGLEDKFEAQQERIDRLEMSLEKILTAVEDIDDSKVNRKIDKIDKQLAKLSTNIEKLASYVD